MKKNFLDFVTNKTKNMTKNLTKEEILILIQLLRISSCDRGLNQKIIEAINVSNKEMDFIFEKLKTIACEMK